MSVAPNGTPATSGLEVASDVTSTRSTCEGSLPSALRAATLGTHRRLEAALPLTDPRLTIDAYRNIVEAFYGFYAPLEARLARLERAGANTPFLAERAKVGRLHADLLSLGSTDAAVDALPICPAVPEVATPGAALGCLYVMEGATLGGRVA